MRKEPKIRIVKIKLKDLKKDWHEQFKNLYVIPDKYTKVMFYFEARKRTLFHKHLYWVFKRTNGCYQKIIYRDPEKEVFAITIL